MIVSIHYWHLLPFFNFGFKTVIESYSVATNFYLIISPGAMYESIIETILSAEALSS